MRKFDELALQKLAWSIEYSLNGARHADTQRKARYYFREVRRKLNALEQIVLENLLDNDQRGDAAQ